MAAPKKTLKLRSSRTHEFIAALEDLPKAVQETAAKAFKFWRDNPTHSSLKVHKLSGQQKGKWAIRINRSYRAVYMVEENGGKTYWWLWIGTHEAYNKRFKK